MTSKIAAANANEPYRIRDVEHLAVQVRSGDRRALAKALSLIESTRVQDRTDQHALLAALYPWSGNALRIGITGPPGAGKSTLIEALGLHATQQQHRVAVLATDPASTDMGGSILGDKLRMRELANHPDAFIRPSSNRGSDDVLSRRIRECIIACEAAGYTTIIVETVGAGQSDTSIADVVDMVVLVTLPHAGDDVQGIKRGVMEVADLIVVTKADLDPRATTTAVSHLKTVVNIFRSRFSDWHTHVLSVSSMRGEGIAELWSVCQQFFAPIRMPIIQQQRRIQRQRWLDSALKEELSAALLQNPALKELTAKLYAAVEEGTTLPPHAAAEIVHAFRSLPCSS